MTYEAKDYSGILGTAGFSDDLLNMHFKLYQGYVANTNKAADLLTTTEKGSPAYNEIKRRFGWEFNGMRLHEYYFGNISKEATDMGAMEAELTKHFGSVDAWKADFKATGGVRGIGWVILAYDAQEDRMFNVWINEHDLGHLAGATPLLVMDVFEHAFITEYGLARADYINAFMNAIDWNAVNSRRG